ncbi:unnamed protein product [Mytilus edulis]|uniref:Integrase core domain-containing protein n=1 Tax=Mytilus edulis TaxID=6550 RepID=A0A8S3SUS4_MYTED|nr:unnamed protein product [Mytilus edulis]
MEIDSNNISGSSETSHNCLVTCPSNKWSKTMESSNILKLLCCLLCVADHDVTGIPYPGDDASVPELVQYYHQLCYTSLQICGFLLFVHGTFMSCSMLKRLKRRLNIRRRNNQSPLPTVICCKSKNRKALGYTKTSFTQFWRNRFQDFQDTGLLNVSCPVHKECVRFCFLSVIQHQLDMFAENWNSHRIRRQRAEVVTPSGIPNMLYYQPEIFGGRDCSFPLPCNLQTIDNLMRNIQRTFQSMAVAMNLLTLSSCLLETDEISFPSSHHTMTQSYCSGH